MRPEIDEIVQKLVAEYAPEKIILFGSYAHGEPDEDSDIDLFIIKATSERWLDRWTTVRRILADRRRMLPLDTVVLTPEEVSERLAAGDQFIAGILEKGEVLYAG